MNSENSTTEEQNKNAPQQQKWEWIPCVYDLKQSQGDLEVIQNLAPSIILNVPGNTLAAQNQGATLASAQTGEGIVPNIKLDIELNKDFIFTEGLGWNWHKSWNIPDLYCTLDIRDPNTHEKLLPPQKLHAELFVCRANINDINTFHLQDVGVKGSNKAEFEGTKCVFSGLKFNSTSYNFDGAKFHLVIVIYLSQSKLEQSKILESKISPPIFVDSRKSARDTQKQKTQKLSSFIQPFNPENLDKVFVKRESKKKQTFEEVIDNNFEGLSNFFSAPNIRHKVKHPLFLAFRFSQCIKLYYNQDTYKECENTEQLVESFQKTLYKIFQNQKLKQNKVDLKAKPLILYIVGQPNSNRKSSISSNNNDSVSNNSIEKGNKNISDFMEPIVGEQLHILTDINEIPENFKLLEDIDQLKQKYLDIYSKLVNDKQNFEIEMMEQLSNGDPNTPYLKAETNDQQQQIPIKPINLNNQLNMNMGINAQNPQIQMEQKEKNHFELNNLKRKRKQSKNINSNKNEEDQPGDESKKKLKGINNNNNNNNNNGNGNSGNVGGSQSHSQQNQMDFPGFGNMFGQFPGMFPFPFQMGSSSSQFGQQQQASQSSSDQQMQEYSDYLQQKLKTQQDNKKDSNNQNKNSSSKSTSNNQNEFMQQNMGKSWQQMMQSFYQNMMGGANTNRSPTLGPQNPMGAQTLFQFMNHFMGTMPQQQQTSQQNQQLYKENMMYTMMLQMLSSNPQMPFGMCDTSFLGTSPSTPNLMFSDPQMVSMMFQQYQQQQQQSQQNEGQKSVQNEFLNMFQQSQKQQNPYMKNANNRKSSDNKMEIEQAILMKSEEKKQNTSSKGVKQESKQSDSLLEPVSRQLQFGQESQNIDTNNLPFNNNFQMNEKPQKKKSVDITLIQDNKVSFDFDNNSNNNNLKIENLQGGNQIMRKNSGFQLSSNKKGSDCLGTQPLIPSHKNSISTQGSLGEKVDLIQNCSINQDQKEQN